MIAVLSSNRLYSCVPFLASLYLQIPVSPLDITLDYDETIHFLTVLRPRLLFCEEEKVSQIELALKETNVECDLVIFGSSKEYATYSQLISDTWNKSADCEFPFQVKDVEDLFSTAVIMFTSGTTSAPKGICCTHYGLMSAQLNFKYVSTCKLLH